MPVLEYTQETLPRTRTEFVRQLESARQNADPLDDLLSLNRQLLAFEQRHDMTSDDFYVRYKRGELGDSMDMVQWAGRYRLYHELKDEINESLAFIITERVAVPA